MNLRKAVLLASGLTLVVAGAFADDCQSCHKTVTPSIVSDWQLSRHSQNDVECSTCHGGLHMTADDFAKAAIPTPDTCANCHEERVEQFKRSKRGPPRPG